MSLAELLVAMGMASVLLLALGTLFVSSLRENRSITAKTTTTADARIALEAITRELRVAVIPKNGSATAITAASATSVTFYSSIGVSSSTTDPTPSLVTLAIDTTRHCLYRSITPGTLTGSILSWPSANMASGCVARGNLNSALFTYYPLAADDSISTTAFTSGQLASNLGNIAAVGINMVITDPANPAVVPTTLQDQVTLTNIATGLAD